MAEYILKTELSITTCRVCPCAEHTPFGTACPIKRGSEKRYGTCPLVEVPPHGRLVDADTNREDFMDTVYSELYSDGDNYRANRIIDAYDNAPTVLEAST